MDKDDVIVLAGGGGFIGGHLAAALIGSGYRSIRCVDIRPTADWHRAFPEAVNLQLDLREKAACDRAVQDARYVFNFAADMGGMGFIERHKADCMVSVLINTNLLRAAHQQRTERFFYASSACVYAADKQRRADVRPLRESDAYPAMPEDGYGWEKLFSERMCRHFSEDYGLATRVARFHNVYGPHGTYDGGREKAPAAICRKVVTALMTGAREIEIWGDGEQTRTFLYIDDCLAGTLKLMASELGEPINVGSDELVSINQLVDIVEGCAGIRLRRRYDLTAPLGVRGRSSDNTLAKERLGWAPSTPLAEGMRKTYRWIHDQMQRR